VAVTVRIPTPLRRITNGVDRVSVDAQDLRSVIERLDRAHPGIKDRLCDESGELRHFVNVYLNGEDVRYLRGLATTTKTGDEVSIVPAVAGGA
jgi:molybdopterin synthase sulfur carrier subunit